jgi:hypothetical protein
MNELLRSAGCRPFPCEWVESFPEPTSRTCPFARRWSVWFRHVALFGKTYWLDDTYAIGYYGDIGYRVRVNPAPNEVFGTAGLFGNLGP